MTHFKYIFIPLLFILISTQSCLTKEPNKDSNVKRDTVPTLPKYIDSTAFRILEKKLANGDTTGKWPVKNTPIPAYGALLPFNRIVAFYGNLYSNKMGILGELPPKLLLEKLNKEVKSWQLADSLTPVIPALHYIAVVAQGAPGKDGKYKLRMPYSQIDSVLKLAKLANAIVFLDIQVALSSLKDELPLLEPYLKMPQVHLGIDPEFSMKTGKKPGTVIGTFDASDINYASKYLEDIVKNNHITPKILVIHRFTKNMITNYKSIQKSCLVQLVIDMDGWGHAPLKQNTYRCFIYKEPVQYAGFKLFYKNDLKDNGRMLTPKELLSLTPKPIYIQYQ